METKIKFFITPRQVGKTTKLVYEFLKYPENSIIIVCNNSMKSYVIKQINNSTKGYFSNGFLHERIFAITDYNTVHNAKYIIRNKCDIKMLLIDEYLLFNFVEKDRINEILQYVQTYDLKDIIVYSTPVKTYDKQFFIDFREFIENNVFYNVKSRFLRQYPHYKRFENDIDELTQPYSLLIQPFVELMFTDFGVSQTYEGNEKLQGLKKVLPEEKFKTEGNGLLLENKPTLLTELLLKYHTIMINPNNMNIIC